MKHQTSYRQRVFVTVGRSAVAQGASGSLRPTVGLCAEAGWVRTGVIRGDRSKHRRPRNEAPRRVLPDVAHKRCRDPVLQRWRRGPRVRAVALERHPKGNQARPRHQLRRRRFKPRGARERRRSALLSAWAHGTGRELWRSDGTRSGTKLVSDIKPGARGSTPFWITDVAGTAFFRADDGVHGNELWKAVP